MARPATMRWWVARGAEMTLPLGHVNGAVPAQRRGSNQRVWIGRE
jgi:hypothetical protein